MKKLESDSFDVNGVWEFSTEGDCEGRATKKLGKFTGNLFDGIKQYGSQSYYTLSCKRVDYVSSIEKSPEKKRVHFKVYDSAIEMHDSNDALAKLTSEIPGGHSLVNSNYYGCVALEWEE